MCDTLVLEWMKTLFDCMSSDVHKRVWKVRSCHHWAILRNGMKPLFDCMSSDMHKHVWKVRSCYHWAILRNASGQRTFTFTFNLYCFTIFFFYKVHVFIFNPKKYVIKWGRKKTHFIHSYIHWLHCVACRTLVPWRGIESGTRQWKCWVLSTRPSGHSQENIL